MRAIMQIELQADERALLEEILTGPCRKFLLKYITARTPDFKVILKKNKIDRKYC
jgi:hypothetical protein